MLSLILSTSTSSLFHGILVLKNCSSYCLEIHKTNIQDSQGATHSLSRYYAMRNEPRPGSSTTVRTLQLESSEAWIGFGNSYTENRLQLPNLAGTSVNSRWTRNASDLPSLAVTSVVPVDLNAFILKVLELNWSIFDEGLGLE